MRNENQLDFWFLENLVCPIDKSKLTNEKNKLICEKNLHSYPIYKNIPIMLIKEKIPTHSGLFQNTWDILNGKIKIDENLQTERSEKIIDPFVQKFIGSRSSLVDFFGIFFFLAPTKKKDKESTERNK